MNNQILIILKQKLDELARLGTVDTEIQRNVVKEELQYYVLHFLYHHTEYSTWTMYGGSALRICHGLNRMSVDLDFEITHACTNTFLENLKTDIEKYFADTYGLGTDALVIKITNNRGLTLRFLIGDALGMGHPSKQVHVKIDLNHFVSPKTATERIPIHHGQLSFVIMTYTMSTLMASKIAAVLSRGKRSIGTAVYEEKGRDIYDLLWYMEKKIIPNLDYLKAKNIPIADFRKLFDTLTIKIGKVSDVNLKQDLLPLFVERAPIEHWLLSWRENYMRLVATYAIHTITILNEVLIFKHVRTDTLSFTYRYKTEDSMSVAFEYSLSGYWMKFREGDIPTKINKNIIERIPLEMAKKLNDKEKQYATLFYQKTEAYLKKTNNVVMGDRMITKTIRMTADKLDRKEEIVLNASALLSSELDDLLK